MKMNWEYDVPKLRTVLTAVIVVLGIVMIAFEWTKADFIFKILLGITWLLDAALSWMQKHRISAALLACLALLFFGFAVKSYFLYNV